MVPMKFVHSHWHSGRRENREEQEEQIQGLISQCQVNKRVHPRNLTWPLKNGGWKTRLPCFWEGLF